MTFPYFNSTCRYGENNESVPLIVILPMSAPFFYASYVQRSHGESAHVVPEDQGALRPGGGDGRALEVSGLTVAAV